MSWIYHQVNGAIWHNDQFAGVGYSGHGEGKNNPEMQQIHDIGPIPKGRWKLVEFVPHMPGLGLDVIALLPRDGTETFGRSGFYWHGDNSKHPGEASHGCIVSGLDVRVKAWESGDHDLEVV